MADNIDKSEIRRLTRYVYETLSGGDPEWPNCHNAAARITQRLTNQYGVDDQFVQVQEYMLPEEYGHYTVYLAPEVLGTDMIIDASFEQFANETEAPIDIAPAHRIDSVVFVQPAQRYVFDKYKQP